MAAHLATPHWSEIRRLAEQGVSLPSLATEYGVSIKTIYNRVATEDWLTPSRLKAKIFQTDKQMGLSRIMPLSTTAVTTEKGEALLHDTWENRATDLRNLSYGVAVQAIREAKGQIVIESASDLKHAVHVARQATGLLDTDAPALQLSLFTSHDDISGPPIMEAQLCDGDALQPVSDVDGFWE